MRFFRRQEGSTMLLFIGIAATLAIAAVALTGLIGNVQANSHRDQSRTKAFNVAEGALNVAMQKLKANWPSSVATGATWTTTDASSFRAEYLAVDYPDPPAGAAFATVSIFDNSDTNGDGAISPTDANYDKGGGPGGVADNRMYIRVTAKVLTGTATIQGLVERTLWTPAFPRGIAVYSGGSISSNSQGGGTMPKVTVDPLGLPPTSDGKATAYAVSGYDPPAIMDSNLIVPKAPPDSVPPLNQVISPALIADLKSTAIMGGRYFSGANAVTNAQNSLQNAMGGPGLQGLTVIEPATGTSGDMALPSNTVSTPACLVVLGGNGWGFNNAGGGNTYGFYFTQGNFDFARGNFSVHGMIVCAGDVGFKGTPQLIYDDRVIVKLMSEWTLNVKLVPNTWRELSPGATN
jgi:hypothetical protein